MGTALFELQDILRIFQQRKVLTKQELLQEAGCSTMTLWRLLSRHGYFTSYNDNARHYTIVGIPKFDERGLWSYRKVRFSKWGSLTKTIIALVQESSTGLNAGQLEQLLGISNAKPALTRLVEKNSLTREKIGGRFVYFPVDDETRAKQHKQRIEESEKTQSEQSLPPLEHIVSLLVEIIQHPQQMPRQWARRLARQGIRIKTKDIQAVLDYYNIDPKKGLLKS